MSDSDKLERKLTSYMEEKATSVFDLDTTMELISKGFPIRTFSEEFKRTIYKKALSIDIPQEDLIKRLKVDLGAQNFSNWWNGLSKSGKPIAISRENAIKIAFYLEMDVAEAQQFLTHSCWHDGFYLRNYKDLIYVFFLDNKLNYSDALEMIKKHSALDNPNPDIKEVPALLPGNERITDKLKKQLENNVTTVEELDLFLKHYASYFGSFHRKAYEKFIKLYDLIKNANDLEATTDDEIVESVMKNTLALKDRGKITNEILVKITENIFGSKLSEIINKSVNNGTIVQVKRKHLILFWLYLYGGTPELDDIPEAQNAFEECMHIINYKLLKVCGMPILDARNPFDWLVINALYYCHFADDDVDAVERIHAVMDTLFQERDEEN